jgi:hypothetical protein
MAPAAVGAILLTLAGLRLVREGGIVRLPPRDRALLDAQRWARTHSAPGSLFLPLGIDGFSTLSRRPVWVDWKVGAVVMWAPNLHATWSSRHAELKRVRSIPDGLDLARREGCAYLVCDASFDGAPSPTDTLVYSNAACRIYRVAEAKNP